MLFRCVRTVSGCKEKGKNWVDTKCVGVVCAGVVCVGVVGVGVGVGAGVAVKLGFICALYFFSGVAGCSGKKLTNLMEISQ